MRETRNCCSSFYRYLTFAVLASALSVISADVNGTNHKTEKKARPRNFSYIKRDSYTDAAASVSTLGTFPNAGSSSGSSYPEDSYNSPSGNGDFRNTDYSSINNQVQYSPPSLYGVPSGGYGSPMKTEATSVKYHYKIVPQKETNHGWGVDSYEDYEEEKDDKWKGLLGLLGLTGLVGLKPLKLLGILALPLAPVLVPIVLLLGGLLLAAPIIIGLLLLLFIPIPSLYFPPGTLNAANGVLVVGRAQITNTTALNDTTSRAIDFSSPSILRSIFRAVSTEYTKTSETTLASTECIERASCELAKYTRSYNPNIVSAVLRSIRKMFRDNDNQYMTKIDLGLSKAGYKCYQFQCDSFPLWTKTIKSKIS
ncbi:unnamed protein product [Allacma fusca]|uniref:Uncharacterized protein n=1 Tax=Allacma fusca TaxID=39272 RepID=A0A8J2JZK5_9HEXA|nr:unnamed protein product [Allacma fusca]